MKAILYDAIEATVKALRADTSVNIPKSSISLSEVRTFDAEKYKARTDLTDGQQQWIEKLPKDDGTLTITFDSPTGVVPVTYWASGVKAVGVANGGKCFVTDGDAKVPAQGWKFSMQGGVLVAHAPAVTSIPVKDEPKTNKKK